jgi:hypothetical protein
MKEALLNPHLYKPEVKGEMTDQFLIRIGIPISKSPDKNSLVSIRFEMNQTSYGFKDVVDAKAMVNFLIDNDIDFEFKKNDSKRYYAHIILKK